MRANKLFALSAAFFLAALAGVRAGEGYAQSEEAVYNGLGCGSGVYQTAEEYYSSFGITNGLDFIGDLKSYEKLNDAGDGYKIGWVYCTNNDWKVMGITFHEYTFTLC